MTLQEYIAQEDPIRMPNVVLTADEITEIQVLNGDRLVKINCFSYLYLIPSGTNRLWSMDDHQNKKSPSCFRMEVKNRLKHVDSVFVPVQTSLFEIPIRVHKEVTKMGAYNSLCPEMKFVDLPTMESINSIGNLLEAYGYGPITEYRLTFDEELKMWKVFYGR